MKKTAWVVVIILVLLLVAWGIFFYRSIPREIKLGEIFTKKVIFVGQVPVLLRKSPFPVAYFSKISEAMEFAANSQSYKKIFLFPGVYEGKIIFPSGVELIGSQLEETVIELPSNSLDPNITLGENNTIRNIKIRGGLLGIKILPNSRAIIENCEISQTGQYGIYSEKSDTIAEDKKLSIIRSKVLENKLQGMYLQKGWVEVVDSVAENNGEEGIDIHPWMKAFIRNNIARNNGEGGIEVDLEDNEIVIEGNVSEGNKSSGINLQSGLRDAEGKVTVRGNTLKNNGEFGIRCVKQGRTNPKFFTRVATIADNVFEGNAKGDMVKMCNK